MEDAGRDRAIRDLLESPLASERDRAPRSWRPILAGMLVGAVLAGTTGVLLAGDGDDVLPTSGPGTASPTTMGADAVPVPPDSVYPPKFRQVTDGAALAPVAVVELEGRRFVSVATFVARGADVPQTWFRGGRWELGLAGGERVPMIRTVRELLVPGVFVVEFGDSGGAAPVTLHLTERWDADVRQVSASIDLPEFPFFLDTPLTVEISGGVSLVIEELELGDTNGRAVWRIDGVEELAGELVFGVGIFDESGQAMPGYGARGSGFLSGFFPGDATTLLTAAPASGEVALFGASTRSATPVRAEVSVTVPLLRTLPASLELPLAGVPIDTR